MNSLYLFSRFPLGTGLSGRVLCRVTPTWTTNIWAAVWPLARNRGVCKKQKIKIKIKFRHFLKIKKNSGTVLQTNPTLYSAFWGHDFQNFIFGAQINTRSAALLRNNCDVNGLNWRVCSTVTRVSFPQRCTLFRALHLPVSPVGIFARRHHNTTVIPVKIHIVIPSGADAFLRKRLPSVEARQVSAIH